MELCKEKQKQIPSNGYAIFKKYSEETRRDRNRNEILREKVGIQNLVTGLDEN
jgi:hypothetical protein